MIENKNVTGNRFTIEKGDLANTDVIELLEAHRAEMFLHSPPENVHALNLDGLKTPDMMFWTVSVDRQLAGCGAFKDLGDAHGEIKSMRTAQTHLRQGVASAMLQFIICYAKNNGFRRISLETGSMTAFEPARRLYEKNGFKYTAPFSDYKEDPHSLFMSKTI